MKIISRIFKGIGIGLICALGLYVVAFVINLGACILTCGYSMFWPRSCFPAFMWSGVAFGNTLVFTLAVGFIVGTIYGITEQIAKAKKDADDKKRKEEAEAEAEKRRREKVERDKKTEPIIRSMMGGKYSIGKHCYSTGSTCPCSYMKSDLLDYIEKCGIDRKPGKEYVNSKCERIKKMKNDESIYRAHKSLSEAREKNKKIAENYFG